MPSSYNYEGISSLNVPHLANGGQNSGIGASTNAAVKPRFQLLQPNLAGSGGTGVLNYVGTGDSTDRLFTIASGRHA